MKRTKERLDFAHPKEREGISGCTFFGIIRTTAGP